MIGDRDLLLGVMATQLRRTTPERVAAAVQGWAGGGDLGALLVERGALSAADRELLERLVDEAVAAHVEPEDPRQAFRVV